MFWARWQGPLKSTVPAQMQQDTRAYSPEPAWVCVLRRKCLSHTNRWRITEKVEISNSQTTKKNSSLPIASHWMNFWHIGKLFFPLAAAGVLLTVELEGHLLNSISLCFQVAQLNLSLERETKRNCCVNPEGMHFKWGVTTQRMGIVHIIILLLFGLDLMGSAGHITELYFRSESYKFLLKIRPE